MMSLFLDRYSAWHRRFALVFGLAALVILPERVVAQETIEPVTPERIVVHGTESHFDLTNLGPHFSEIWLDGILPGTIAPDEAPALTQRIAMTSAAGGWVQRTRTTYERNEAGQPRERHVERWNDTTWANESRTTYVYRGRTLIGQRTEVWVDGAWQPDRKLSFAHGDAGHVREVVHQARRGDRWVKTGRLTIGAPDTSQQHAPGALVSQRRLVRETWTEGTWEPVTRVTFTVAEEGRHIIQRNETWTGAEWEANVRLMFMYDGAGYPIEKSVDVWTGAQWAEGPLHLYDYEIHERRVEQRTETWVGTNRLRTERTEFTYATPLSRWLLSEVPPSD